MATQHLTASSISQLGQEIYDRSLRDQFESQHHGKFVLIHVDTEDYEIDNDQVAASQRAMARHPDGRWFMIRVGYPAATRIGWSQGPNG
jgi:hypothetical protein